MAVLKLYKISPGIRVIQKSPVYLEKFYNDNNGLPT